MPCGSTAGGNDQRPGMACEFELVADYFNDACVFERLAMEESNQALRDLYREHARICRRLAADSMADLALPTSSRDTMAL
jgi:hypothetical protein